MKRKPTIIALALLLAVSTAFAVPYQKGPKNGAKPNAGQRECLLTDKEKSDVADVKRDFEKAAIPLRADIKVLRMELDELILAGKSTDAKLNELNAAKAKLSKEQVKHKVEVRKIVGEDKYKQMDMFKRYHMQNKMNGKHGGKKGRNMSKGPNEYGEGGRQFYKQPVVK